MRLSDFDYNLPKELIAQHPLPRRDTSRLLVLGKETGDIEHKSFKDLPSLLSEGDLLVLNDTKVFNARLIGKREGFNGKVEVLLMDRIENNLYSMLCKPARKLKKDTRLIFGNGSLTAVVEGEREGFKLIRFSENGDLFSKLERIGKVPLPPYIKRQAQASDGNRYQTVYAKNVGAIAAPTAGLHFTEALLSKIKAKQIDVAYLTLHVGFATFKPVEEEDLSKHIMHKEYFDLSKETATKINRAKKDKRRIVAVGTTTCRTLESATVKGSTGYELKAMSSATDLFIKPGYNFKITDALITNFHLPKTTLLMLISALAKREKILNAYKEAIDQKYRFYSYGDAMLII